MAVVRSLRQPIDFERVLKTRSCASSAHFAVHHVAGSPVRRQFKRRAEAPGELSTGAEFAGQQLVDDSVGDTGQAIWLGTVVPKRHARRAVTRNLLKRQIRNAVADGAAALSGGLWVVRLRAPFDRAVFTSAASDALRQHTRSELQDVLAMAIGRQPRR